MAKFRIESRNTYQRSENLLGKTQCNRMTEGKRNTCTFHYSTRVMNNHARSTLTWPTGCAFSHINAR